MMKVPNNKIDRGRIKGILLFLLITFSLCIESEEVRIEPGTIVLSSGQVDNLKIENFSLDQWANSVYIPLPFKFDSKYFVTGKYSGMLDEDYIDLEVFLYIQNDNENLYVAAVLPFNPFKEFLETRFGEVLQGTAGDGDENLEDLRDPDLFSIAIEEKDFSDYIKIREKKEYGNVLIFEIPLSIVPDYSKVNFKLGIDGVAEVSNKMNIWLYI